MEAIYHGATSPKAITDASAAAPELTHGYCWTPGKMTPHDTPYILDNGVYSAWVNDEPWPVQDWAAMLTDAQDMPREPVFAVLPDVVGDWEKSLERTHRYAAKVPDNFPTALAVQDGAQTEQAVLEAVDLGCDWIFVGGTAEWKRRMADRYVMTAHDYGLKCHIARPGLPDGLLWADGIGADSVDTTTIARGGAYHHLRAFHEQATLTDASQNV